jgi:hypothetical protein
MSPESPNEAPDQPFSAPPERESSSGPWIGLSVGALLIIGTVAFLIYSSRKDPGRTPRPQAVMQQAPRDPYAGNLELSGIKMSQAENLLGGRSIYIEGNIKNTGDKTVTGASGEVTFHNSLNEVVQRENHVVRVVLAREPAVDVAALSMSPLKPGESKEFQLIFEHVSADWNGQYPELRITTVTTR